MQMDSWHEVLFSSRLSMKLALGWAGVKTRWIDLLLKMGLLFHFFLKQCFLILIFLLGYCFFSLEAGKTINSKIIIVKLL